MSKLTVAETRSAMSDAWAKARDAADEFGGRASEYFREALRQAYEAIRKALQPILSAADRLRAEIEDRRSRAPYIDDHFQHRNELAKISALEKQVASIEAAEEEHLAAIEGYAAASRGPIAPLMRAPVRTKPAIPEAYQAIISGKVEPIDAQTRVDLRGICGHRRRAA